MTPETVIEDWVERMGKDLFDFAVDREDVKTLMARLPQMSEARPVRVEYELQILRIILVGWGLSYLLETGPRKTAVQDRYWQSIQAFSRSLSDTAGLLIGQDIDYFQALKDRLSGYLTAMDKHAGVREPAAVIGPEFARLCGSPNDPHVVMIGSRMCVATLNSVHQYLEGLPADRDNSVSVRES